ncbi:hypothetical protein BCR32DRAFT_264053 [Anaeromyces robustus]|uniref:Methylosome subunit pICln n=1 Tax=Anaeromyces robustus TaxID=1754192 RepID=A0A1Y1XPZ0_9FUNG|nr:hypothetical protein BCR32DRAFT_264053 [Anaeromyces robustus]|eukprot:ORX87813.1 hypothetical protein BCR32DRAFT_264053 [Anaeromyces robustus]
MPIKIISKLSEDIEKDNDKILKFTESNVLLKISPDIQCLNFLNSKPNGTIYVTTEEIIYWLNNIQKGISIDYNTISMHAISSSSEQNKRCIYMQLDNNKCTIFNENKDILPIDIKKSENETNTEEEIENYMEDDDDYIIEFNFIFENEIKLTLAYEEITRCTELHPDPDDSMDESEMFDINYFNQMETEFESPIHEPPENDDDDNDNVKRQKI